MDKKKMQGFRDLLNNKMESSQELLNKIQEANQVESHEISSSDSHPADLGTELFDKEHGMALEAAQELTVKEINQALKKTENGTYGICEFCKNAIDPKRLKVLPQTRYCIECENNKENELKQLKKSHVARPIEEETMSSSSHL